MGALSQDDDDIQASINITPLVDIFLVLLIIFMLTATFMRRPVVPVDLPRAANADEAKIKTFALVMDKKGALYLDGKPSTERAAWEKLVKAYRRDKDVQAIVAADGSVQHRQVVRLIDLVRSTGISKFAINVRREDLKR
jgi:biopolymer transport protein ExbD